MVMELALFVKIIDQVGGTELGTQRLARALSDRGIAVTLLSTQGLSQWQRRPSIYDYANSFRLIRLPVWQRSPTVFAQMLRLHSHWIFPTLLRNTQIIHLRSLSSETLQIAGVAQQHAIKTLCVPAASGSFGDAALLPPNAIRHLDALDRISTLTPAMQAEMVALGFPENRISVTPNGVDPAYWSPPDQPPAQLHVIFVGQFRPEKQLDTLLQAWQQVQDRCPEATLTLVGGSGQSLAHYQQRAATLGITPRFTATVAPDAVLNHLQTHSIFVMPGSSEGMSNALLEAMAVGLAPVVSDTPANCTVVKNRVNGLTYDCGSPADLATQLMCLLRDSALRERLGSAARATVLQHYTLDRAADAYLTLYERLLPHDA